MATVVIGGSTASGKSALALRIAERTGGLIVNADSVQMYRDLPILTARPGEADTARAEHCLYGVLAAGEESSAAAWLDRVRIILDNQQESGRTLIFVGGTGFYLKCLLHGLAPMPEIDAGIRRAVRDDPASSEHLHAELVRADPQMAARLRTSDRQRIMRALEVMRGTGRSLLDWQADPPVRLALPQPVARIALLPGRDRVRQRIGERLDRMIAAGLVDEVAAFVAGLGDRASPLLKADGVAEFQAHLAGGISLHEARQRTFDKVSRYAKRQRTFFRHQLPDFRQVEGFADDVPADLIDGL